MNRKTKRRFRKRKDIKRNLQILRKENRRKTKYPASNCIWTKRNVKKKQKPSIRYGNNDGSV